MSDSFFNPKTSKTASDEDTVYTMGGLDSLPDDQGEADAADYLSRAIPNITFDQFTGTLGQLSQLFPGVQVKPNYQPGLTDIRYTRGYYGTGADVSPEEYGTKSAGHLFWSPQRYQLPVVAQTTTTTSATSSGVSEEQNLESALQFFLESMSSVAPSTPVTPVTSVRPTTTATTVFPTTTTAVTTLTDSTVTAVFPTTTTAVFPTTTTAVFPTTTTAVFPTTTTAVVTATATTDYFTTTTAVFPTTTTAVVTATTTAFTTTTATVPTTVTTSLPTMTDDEAFVNKIYQDLFERDADIGGLDYWTSQLESGKSREQLIRDIYSGAQGADIGALQDENLNQYLEDYEASQVPEAERSTLNDIYRQNFGRDIDKGGLVYWSKEYDAGKTLEQIRQSILSGASEADRAYMRTRSLEGYTAALNNDVQQQTSNVSSTQDEINKLKAQAQQEINDSYYVTSGYEGVQETRYGITDPYKTTVGEQLRAKEAELTNELRDLRNTTTKLNDAEKNFAAESYKANNPDAAASNLDPLTHFLIYGRGEQPSNFVMDADAYYLERNPDVANSGLSPYEHYLLKGFTEGRADVYGTPEQEYLRAYPDVAAAIREGRFSSAEDHYKRVGAAEGRTAGYGQVDNALKTATNEYIEELKTSLRQPGIAGPPSLSTIRDNFIERIAQYSPGILNAVSKTSTALEGASSIYKAAANASLLSSTSDSFIRAAGFSSKDAAIDALVNRAGYDPALAADLVNSAGVVPDAAEALINVSKFAYDDAGSQALLDSVNYSSKLLETLDTGTMADVSEALQGIQEFTGAGKAFLSESADAVGEYLGVEGLSSMLDGALSSGVPYVGLIMDAFGADDYDEFASSAADTLATAAVTQAASYALASLGIPGAGPFIAAAIALDAVLAEALGYDSFIQDAISWVSGPIDNFLGWAGENIGDIWSGIQDFFGGLFAEGGLVDLPGDSMYNENTQGVLPDIEAYAQGGVIPLPGGGKIAKGPGGGLDDLIPTSIDGRRAAALSDGEFVIPADVVSMMGDGSTNAGSKRLYDLVRQVRQAKTGTSRQAGPLQVGKILERTMR